MIRKVFMATINYDHPQSGMLKAFRGIFGPENVTDFDYLEMNRNGISIPEINRRFVEEAIRAFPGWIWLQLQNTGIITAESIRTVKEELPRCAITNWMGDARSAVSHYLASVCKETHLTMISSVGQIPIYEAAGAREVKYLQIGLDWDEDVAGLPDWMPPFQVPEVVFIGNNYSGDFPGTGAREAAINALRSAEVNVGVVGSGWKPPITALGSCTVKQQFHVWKRAKVAISTNNFNEIELYYSDRPLIAMSSGTPLVCFHIPGLEREFRDGEHCLFYKSLEDLVQKVKWLLSDDQARATIGRAGRAEVIRRHTWVSRVLDALPWAEEIERGLP